MRFLMLAVLTLLPSLALIASAETSVTPRTLLYYGPASGRFVHVTVQPLDPTIPLDHASFLKGRLLIHVGQSPAMRPHRILFLRGNDPILHLDLETGTRLNFIFAGDVPRLLLQTAAQQSLFYDWVRLAAGEGRAPITQTRVDHVVNDLTAKAGELFSYVNTPPGAPSLNLQDEVPPVTSLADALACEALIASRDTP